MGYTLQSLAAEIKSTLKSGSMPESGHKVAEVVGKALQDPGFVAATFSKKQEKVREVIYEDPDLGFCICAHVYEGAASSPAHDHGPSWAIYGQAVGETEMTDWKITKRGEGDNPTIVEPERVYTLAPGMAKFYPAGAVHSPKRAGATKLLRIEGANLDHIKRSNIKAA